MVFVKHVIEKESSNLTVEDDIFILLVTQRSRWEWEIKSLDLSKGFRIAYDQLGNISNTSMHASGNEEINGIRGSPVPVTSRS